MEKNYLCGEKVCLRAMEPEDLEVMYTLENDPEMWDVTNFTVPYSKFMLKQYLENTEYDMFADRQLRLMIVRRDNGKVVGTVDIMDFAPMHARGELGIALRREDRGKGYAREALTLICEYAFDFLFMKQLTVHVTVDNEQSLRLFEGCGFVRCGLLKEWWRIGGTFKDVVLMQCLRPASVERGY